MKQSVKMLSKLPKVLRDEIRDADLSLAVYVGSDTVPAIEMVRCVDEATMKVEPALQRSIERADGDTKYVPRSDEIRIIGRSFGECVYLDCRGESSDSADFTISIDHDCDGWVISVEYQSSTRLLSSSGKLTEKLAQR